MVLGSFIRLKQMMPKDKSIYEQQLSEEITNYFNPRLGWDGRKERFPKIA